MFEVSVDIHQRNGQGIQIGRKKERRKKKKEEEKRKVRHISLRYYLPQDSRRTAVSSMLCGVKSAIRVLNMRKATIGGATPNFTNSAKYRTFRIFPSIYCCCCFDLVIPKNSLFKASRTGAAMSSFDMTRCNEAITL